ncbi:septum formation initiator family protein [uncultured Paenibacillus sp.]|uniref:septum formation initiator family protein n=1 Tax=uncultured Paenibacillus sp. TaxID=227322 RepID=UPI0015A897CC|nr:septum formation initiator family protein [uncultured Paenibacillus sp.]
MREVSTNPNPSNKSQSSGNGSAFAKRRLRLWMGFMILFLGWAGYTFISQAGDIGGKSQQLAERQAAKAASEQDLNQLKYEINRLNDPEYIGQIAMKKYGLYKPGEIPVRVSESEAGND